MKFPRLLRSCRPAGAASLLAAGSLVFASCFDMGKKGNSGLVVSSVDPAIAANAGQVDMSFDDPSADYSSSRVEDYLDPEVELDYEADVMPEATVRTEITPSKVADTADLRDYTVKKGDSLWSISREFDTSIAALKRANGMGGDDLIAGKTIRIPGGAPESLETPAPAGTNSPEVVATLPSDSETPAKEEVAEKLPETLPSGVVPPDPPRRPSLTVIEDEPATEEALPVKKAETTIGDDGFLRFDDEE